jgi:hypothetical protein
MTLPIARPVASRRTREAACIEGRLTPARTPKDSPSHRPSRISNRQLERIEQAMTDTDNAVLRFVSDLRVASGSHLRRRFFEGEDARNVRRVLAQLADRRVLDRLPRRIGGVRSGSDGHLYSVGPAGARLLARRGERRRRLEAPGDRYLRHSLAICELVVRLHEADAHGELDVIALETEPRCWRVFTGPAGTRVVIKPDLALRIGAGALEDRWLVEVDLATEARGTLQAKAKRYVAHLRSGEEQRHAGVYPRVLWLVPDERRHQQLVDAFAELPEEHRRLFDVAGFDEAVDFLTAEARS